MKRSLAAAITSAAMGLATGVAAPEAWAVDGPGAWRYSADAAGGARHLARVEDAGHVLAYGCDDRTGRSIMVDLWGPDRRTSTLARRGPQTLSFVFARGGPSGRPQRIDATALPAAAGTGVVVEEPGANALLMLLLEGRYESVTVAAEGIAHSFSLAGAEVIVRQANVACSTSLPSTTTAIDGAWDTFAYGGLFEIDMPDGAQEVDSTIPMGSQVVRYGGIRGSDGHATYTAIVTDVAVGLPSGGHRARFFESFVAGTMEAAQRNGATTDATPVSRVGELARDLRVEHASGATQFMRIVMIGTRIYVLTAICRADPRTIARKDRFVASFRPL